MALIERAYDKNNIYLIKHCQNKNWKRSGIPIDKNIEPQI